MGSSATKQLVALLNNHAVRLMQAAQSDWQETADRFDRGEEPLQHGETEVGQLGKELRPIDNDGAFFRAHDAALRECATLGQLGAFQAVFAQAKQTYWRAWELARQAFSLPNRLNWGTPEFQALTRDIAEIEDLLPALGLVVGSAGHPDASVPSNVPATSDLLVNSLRFLRQQFEKRADKSLCCCLVEWPEIGNRPLDLPPVKFLTSDETFKWEPLGSPYRDMQLGGGEPPRALIDPGARRSAYFSGPEAPRGEYFRLAGEAGKLLNSVPLSAFPVEIPPETLRTYQAQLRWCYVLFDLAWAEIKGSPLNATEKRVWHGDETFPLSALLEWRSSIAAESEKTDIVSEFHRNTVAKFPDPLSCFSIIGDLWRASVYAIDVLIPSISAFSHANEPLPTDLNRPDTFNWVSETTALAIVQNGVELVEQLGSQTTDDAMAFMVRESAAKAAWRLERLVNPNCVPHGDRGRGRNGSPSTIVVGMWKLCEQLTALYEFLHWENVCTDRDGPDGTSEGGRIGLPWWLPENSNGLRPPDVPSGILDVLREKVQDLTGAIQYAYGQDAAKTAAERLLRLRPTNQKSLNKKKTRFEPCRHSDDFTSIVWHGVPYTFSANQAPRIKLLWENWDRGTPDVGRQALLDAVESNSEHLSHVFRGCPAWRTIIVSVKKGTYRLQKPDDSKLPARRSTKSSNWTKAGRQKKTGLRQQKRK